jgi:hypothetical protein
LFFRKVIVMRIFCCNSADGFPGISACEWHTVELLKQTEQSRRDTHIKNEIVRWKHSNLRDSIKPLTHTQEANIWIVYIYFHGNMKCD